MATDWRLAQYEYVHTITHGKDGQKGGDRGTVVDNGTIGKIRSNLAGKTDREVMTTTM